MAEFTNPTTQTVEANANVLFTNTPVAPCCKVRHREGSGIFTMKGGRYLVTFNGNVAVPTGQTVGAINLAIALMGEALNGATMISTPSAVDEFNNVSATIYVDVPCNCCYTLSVENVGASTIEVENANLVIIREVQ